MDFWTPKTPRSVFDSLKTVDFKETRNQGAVYYDFLRLLAKSDKWLNRLDACLPARWSLVRVPGFAEFLSSISGPQSEGELPVAGLRAGLIEKKRSR